MVYVINARYQDLKKMDIIVPVPSGIQQDHITKQHYWQNTSR